MLLLFICRNEPGTRTIGMLGSRETVRWVRKMKLHFDNRRRVFRALGLLVLFCVLASFVGNYIFTGQGVRDIVDPFNRKTGSDLVAAFFEALVIMAVFAPLSIPYGFLALFIGHEAIGKSDSAFLSLITGLVMPLYWVTLLVLLILIIKNKSRIAFGAFSIILFLGAINSISTMSVLLNSV